MGQRTDFFKVPGRGEPKLQYKHKILKKKFGDRVRWAKKTKNSLFDPRKKNVLEDFSKVFFVISRF